MVHCTQLLSSAAEEAGKADISAFKALKEMKVHLFLIPTPACLLISPLHKDVAHAIAYTLHVQTHPLAVIAIA